MKSTHLIKSFVQLLIEQQSKPSSTGIEVYLDMDGVLAGFDEHLSTKQDFVQKNNSLRKLLLTLPEEYQSLSTDDIKHLVKGPQTSPMIVALKKAYKEMNSSKFKIATKQHFFYDLPVLPGAKELVYGVIEMTGNKPHILTAPIQSNKHSAQEKEAWIQKHFAGLYSTFNCTADKHKFAQGNPSNILIDDRTKFIEPFKQAGGSAILYQSGNSHAALSQLKLIIIQQQSFPNLDEQQQPIDYNKVISPSSIIEKKNVSYTGLVLSKADHEKLKQSILKQLEDFDTFGGWEIIAHHVTVNLGAFSGDKSLLRQSFEIQVSNFIKDNLVAAVGVSVSGPIAMKSNPHITFAVNRTLGGKPHLSNKLDWSSAVALKEPIVVTGTLTEVEQGNNLFSDEY